MKFARVPTTLATVLAIVVALTVSTSLEAKDPPKGAAAKPVAKQLLGSWAIDPPRMLAAMKAKAKKDGGGAELEEAAALQMTAMVDAMAGGVMLEFLDDGVARAHQPNKKEDAKYKLLKSDEATGAFTMEISPPDEDADTAECTIKGDVLVMTIKKEQMELHLKRLSPDDRKKHLEAISKIGNGG